LADATGKQKWEPVKLEDVGHVAEVVQGGGGKLTPVSQDTGDIRKPPGQA
jgi:hypothetical protein